MLAGEGNPAACRLGQGEDHGALERIPSGVEMPLPSTGLGNRPDFNPKDLLRSRGRSSRGPSSSDRRLMCRYDRKSG